MNPAELFEIWAPPASVWSPWAKPVLFTALHDVSETFPDAAPTEPSVTWAPDAAARTAIVLDLAGLDAIETGLALARRGYRPVPLFNGCHGPGAAIDVEPMVRRLAGAAPRLPAGLAPDAPPVFLLDARRAGSVPAPGAFDNRWVVLPQDFPSATFLGSHGIRGALLVNSGRSDPRDDLAHVLLRWQEAGIAVSAVDVGAAGAAPRPIVVERPSHFRAAVHALLAMAGLRRGSAGGFGALIPLPPPPGTVGGGARFG